MLDEFFLAFYFEGQTVVVRRTADGMFRAYVARAKDGSPKMGDVLDVIRWGMDKIRDDSPCYASEETLR